MRGLLFASIAIIILGASAPSIISSYLVQGKVTSFAPVTAVAPAKTSAAGRQVEIESNDDGHFYVVAEIDLRPVRLMVDTGASVVALRRSDAEQAGIRHRPSDFTIPVSTANGVTYAAEATLRTVAVRDVEIPRVRALVLPDDRLAVSLLGGTFLNRLARFEVRDGTLIFEN